MLTCLLVFAIKNFWPSELKSKLLVSFLLTLIVTYIIPYIYLFRSLDYSSFGRAERWYPPRVRARVALNVVGRYEGFLQLGVQC